MVFAAAAVGVAAMRLPGRQYNEGSAKAMPSSAPATASSITCCLMASVDQAMATNQTAVISKIFALADVGLKTEAEALLPELTEDSAGGNGR